MHNLKVPIRNSRIVEAKHCVPRNRQDVTAIRDGANPAASTISKNFAAELETGP
jgi:hypothetical protein